MHKCVIINLIIALHSALSDKYTFSSSINIVQYSSHIRALLFIISNVVHNVNHCCIALLQYTSSHRINIEQFVCQNKGICAILLTISNVHYVNVIVALQSVAVYLQ